MTFSGPLQVATELIFLYSAALRDHVNGIYDAMQELLGGLNLPELPHEGGADAEDGDSDDDDPEGEWRL